LASLVPFNALFATPASAPLIAAPPYDVPGDREARAALGAHPQSFLRATRPEVVMAEGADSHSDQAYEVAAFEFAQFIERGLLVRAKETSYAIYRLTWRGRAQTGLVALASADEYREGIVRRHELTRPDKEDDRTRHIETLRAQTGPVFLAFRSGGPLDTIIADLSKSPAPIDFTPEDGVRHEVWRIDAPRDVERIREAARSIPMLYICDGHHRAAAGSRAAERFLGRAEAQHFLAVSFPHTQLRILPYHRLVLDLNGLTVEQADAAIRAATDAPPTISPPPDEGIPGEFGYFLGGRWNRRSLRAAELRVADPSERLDVSVLQRTVLGPIFGIDDPRTSARIRFVGGIKGPGELARAVAAKEAAVGFAMAAATMEQLLAVADAGGLMPPKSTWFEPKLRDGLVVNSW